VLMLILAPWGWGGVVFWVVAATCGLGVAALISAWGSRRFQLVSAVGWVGWAIVAALRTAAALRGSDEPGLLPFVPPAFSLANNPWFEALAFPVAALVGQLLAFAFLREPAASPDAWPRLRRSIPFWAGLAFAAYVALQAANAYGTVVERDLFWRIVPEPHLAWLPAGLGAPLRSDGIDPGAMNGWRLLMILGGPWAFFCALRAAALRRRVLVALAWISVRSGVISTSQPPGRSSVSRSPARRNPTVRSSIATTRAPTSTSTPAWRSPSRAGTCAGPATGRPKAGRISSPRSRPSCSRCSRRSPTASAPSSSSACSAWWSRR